MADNLVFRLAVEGTNKTVEDLHKVARAEQGVGAHAENASRKMSVLTRGLRNIGTAVGVYGVVSVVKKVADAGMALQQQQGNLQNALRDTGLSGTGAFNQIAEASKKAAEHGGFSENENLQAMSNFVRLTKSSTQAIKDTAAATELARGRHIAFATAQRAVAMAVTGSTGRLKQYVGYISPVKDAEAALSKQHKASVIEWENSAAAMNKASAGSGTAWLRQIELAHGITPAMHAAAVEQDKLATGQLYATAIQERYGGATEKFSRSLQGQVSNLKQTFDVLIAGIGKSLIPTFQRVVNVGLVMTRWFERHKTVTRDLGIATAALITVIGGFKAATWVIAALKDIGTMMKVAWVWTRALTGSVMELSLASMWETIQLKAMYVADGFVAIGEGIAAAATWTFAAAVTALDVALGVLFSPILLIYGGLVLLAIGIYEVITHWKQVKAAALDALTSIARGASVVWDAIKKGFSELYQAGGRPFRMIASSAAQAFHDTIHFAEQAWTNIKRGASLAVQWIKGAWHDMTQFIQKDTPLGMFDQLAHGNFGGALHAATFGLLATGGPVTAHPTRYLDSGGPVGTDTVPTMLTPGEGVLNRAAMQQIGDRGLALLNTGQLRGLGGGGQQITIVPGTTQVVLNGREIAKATTQYVLERAARGPSSLSGGALLTGTASG